jgi:hypothetical protein
MEPRSTASTRQHNRARHLTAIWHQTVVRLRAMLRWLWQRTIVSECSKLARKAMTFTTRSAIRGSSFPVDLAVKMNLIGPKRSNVQTDFFVHFIETADLRVRLGDPATLVHPADDLRLAPNFLSPRSPV